MSDDAFTPQMAGCCKKGLQCCNAYDRLREAYKRVGIEFPSLDQEADDMRAMFEKVVEEYEAQKMRGKP